MIINSFVKVFFFYLCDIQKKLFHILCACDNDLIAGEQWKLFIKTKARKIGDAISLFQFW